MTKVSDEDLRANKDLLDSVGATLIKQDNPSFDWYAVPFLKIKDAPMMFAFSWKAPTAGHVIGVSTEVPEEFRKYWAIHEFLEEPKEFPGKCLDTLKQELTMITPQSELARYIPLRATFFGELVRYAQGKNYPQEMIEEFEASRDYLNQLEMDVG